MTIYRGAMFLGRKLELQRMEALLAKNTASLVVVKGRRRIGKSTLIQKFGEKFTNFFEFQGLAPSKDNSNEMQLNNFSRQITLKFGGPPVLLRNWTEAFGYLSSLTRKGKTLILLDEISWMGSRVSDFPGQLKIAWDTEFKKNPKLVLALCGSASAWIEKNILKDADFVGRISLEISLKELPLSHCNQFWGEKNAYVSSMEKLKILSVTGGVPKYLEEIDIRAGAEANIKRLCFEDGGILLLEFEKIFNDIFSRRSGLYAEITGFLANGNRSMDETAKALNIPNNGDLSEYMHELEISGFVSREWVYNPKGKKSRLSRFRLSDNYLRFYLKYIRPEKEKIKKGLFALKSLESLPGWRSIMGFQFENLVLNNLVPLMGIIGIDLNSIVSASPYFQNATKKNRGGCQIDLLIETSFSTLYVCEMKFKSKIDIRVIDDVKQKIHLLKRPKGMSIRPVLIYEGELADAIGETGFFDRLIPFKTLLEG